ncbi:MAG TPA: succinate dehydrogenase, hydrophobic membrane anchor protein [Sphingomonas sp.]|jgi:succinate dehydrogenase / fumarate reductase membrane anchor subunit
MRTAIGQVRGLGSAKEGTHHWMHQRLTAGSNLLLMTWFIIVLARMPAYDYATARATFESAWRAIPLMLLVISVFYHFRLGLQVVIEDYQHNESRVVALIALNLFTVATAAVAIFSILKIAFGASA